MSTNLGAIQYDPSQWWPADVLLDYQLRQVDGLLVHAAKTVPWYRERLKGLMPDKPGKLTADIFRRLPILTRADIQDAGENLHSAKIPPSHGKAHLVRTSGSTGRPITVKTTMLKGLLFHAANLRYHLWHDRDMGAKVAEIRILSQAQKAKSDTHESSPWALVYPSGPLVRFDVTRPVSEQAAWLAAENPDYLMTNPSTLRDLIVQTSITPGSLDRLRHVVTMGEVLEPDVRALCRDKWGVPVVDSYSALQCPLHDHYHIHGEGVLVEILDDNGVPSAPGETGRVVLTDLHNFAMPLIRYELGDYAQVGEACSCGRGLPVLDRVIGGLRNMLTLPGGERTWPRLSTYTLADMPAIRQAQFVQREIGAIDLRLVVSRPLTDAEEAKLTRVIRDSLGHPFDIRFVYVERIERSAGGKFEDFLSQLPPGSA